MSNQKLLYFLSIVNVFVLSSCQSQFTGFSPLDKPDVAHLNGGPLTPAQDQLVDHLNELLRTPSKTSLPEVYESWQELKDSFPPNTTEIINDWEQRRDELLQPVLEQLRDIVRDTQDSEEIETFEEFVRASSGVSSGQDIPNITLSRYGQLQEQSFGHLTNYSDIYMTILTDLSHEFANRTFVAPDVREWFGNLSAIGPEITNKFNETYYTLDHQLSNFKEKLSNITHDLRDKASDVWNKTKDAAVHWRNDTAEWMEDEHPEVVSTWQRIKNGFKNFGNKVKDTWHSFVGIFSKRNDDETTTQTPLFDGNRMRFQ